LFTQHKFKLFDISLSISNGDWQDWKLGNIPPHLGHHTKNLLLSLKGASPIHLQAYNCRGWGAVGYSFKDTRFYCCRIVLQENLLCGGMFGIMMGYQK
jgi:hypothetical protein